MIDEREQFITSNPKQLSHDTQLLLVDIQTSFASNIINDKTISNDEATKLWKIVRKIFNEYGLT